MGSASLPLFNEHPAGEPTCFSELQQRIIKLSGYYLATSLSAERERFLAFLPSFCEIFLI